MGWLMGEPGHNTSLRGAKRRGDLPGKGTRPEIAALRSR